MAEGNVPVFYPTMEEMKDFVGYIKHMESKGAHEVGIAKIVPPPEYTPRKAGYGNIDITVGAPIEQMVSGRNGLYQVLNIERKSMSAEAYKELATSAKYAPPDTDDPDMIERKYWKNITFNSPIYGADTPGSLTDDDAPFNCSKLNTILDDIAGGDASGPRIMGVNTAYLYFGMWKASFCWHTEDMDLYSINYIHFGKPKTWYGIPPVHADRLERLAQEFFSGSHADCKQFLRHKMSLMSPNVLREYSIPCNKIVHREGEFMITFPRAYHAGFNHGYNCAESSNFASDRWIDYGKVAKPCTCHGDTVRIDMDIFIKKYRPDEWVERSKEIELITSDSSSPESAESTDDTVAQNSPKRRRVYTEAEKEQRCIQREKDRAARQIAKDHRQQLREQIKEAREQALILRRLEQEREKQMRIVADRMCREAEIAAKIDAAIRRERVINQAIGGINISNGVLTCSVCMLPGKAVREAQQRPSDATLYSLKIQRNEANLLMSETDIVVCQKCQVPVHRGCYGITGSFSTFECDLCLSRTQMRECSLCPNIGGAMKATTCGKWAHVACALWIPETTFEDAVRLGPITNLKSIPKARWKLRCKICNSNDKNSKPVVRGAPIQCTSGACVTAFHVTCAQRAGYCLRIGNDQQPESLCEAFCRRHTPDEHRIKLYEENNQLQVGTKVKAKVNKSNGVLPGIISNVANIECCEVRFLDGSCANYLELVYVKARGSEPSLDTSQKIKPGDIVDVEWTDNRLYEGQFVRYRSVPKYTVEFDDGSKVVLKASDILEVTPVSVCTVPDNYIGDRIDVPPLSTSLVGFEAAPTLATVADFDIRKDLLSVTPVVVANSTLKDPIGFSPASAGVKNSIEVSTVSTSVAVDNTLKSPLESSNALASMTHGHVPNNSEVVSSDVFEGSAMGNQIDASTISANVTDSNIKIQSVMTTNAISTDGNEVDKCNRKANILLREDNVYDCVSSKLIVKSELIPTVGAVSVQQ